MWLSAFVSLGPSFLLVSAVLLRLSLRMGFMMRVRVRHKIEEGYSSGLTPMAQVYVGRELMHVIQPRCDQADSVLEARDFATVVGREAREAASQMRQMVRGRWAAYLQVLGVGGLLRYKLYPFLVKGRWTFGMFFSAFAAFLWLGAPWVVALLFTLIFALVGLFIDSIADYKYAPPRIHFEPAIPYCGASLNYEAVPTLCVRFHGAGVSRTEYPSDEVLRERAHAQMARSALERMMPLVKDYEDARRERRAVMRFLKSGH